MATTTFAVTIGEEPCAYTVSGGEHLRPEAMGEYRRIWRGHYKLYSIFHFGKTLLDLRQVAALLVTLVREQRVFKLLALVRFKINLSSDIMMPLGMPHEVHKLFLHSTRGFQHIYRLNGS